MFDEHLTKSKVTYLQHLRWAISAGFRLIFSGIASIVHGFVPKLYDGLPAKTIIDIYHTHLKNHPNQDYQDLISEYEDKDMTK